MDERTLLERLSYLGIDEMNYKALPLLALVQVAWADGEIQPAERSLILELAREKWGLGEEGKILLNNWLHFRPTDAYIQRGQQAMVVLAARERGLRLETDQLGDVVGLATDVAKAAGGLFGFGAISSSESAAIQDIARALKIPEDAHMEVVEAIDEQFGAPPRQAKVTLTLRTAISGVANDAVLIPEGSPNLKLPVTRDGVVIGSGESADLRIEFDRAVASKHCEVIERNRSYYIKDLNTTGGTWVNDERVAMRRLLGGETVQVGATKLIFKWLKRIEI
jgi:tellurite resistance protein